MSVLVVQAVTVQEFKAFASGLTGLEPLLLYQFNLLCTQGNKERAGGELVRECLVSAAFTSSMSSLMEHLAAGSDLTRSDLITSSSAPAKPPFPHIVYI